MKIREKDKSTLFHIKLLLLLCLEALKQTKVDDEGEHAIRHRGRELGIFKELEVVHVTTEPMDESY